MHCIKSNTSNIVLKRSINERLEFLGKNRDRNVEHTSNIPLGCQQYTLEQCIQSSEVLCG